MGQFLQRIFLISFLFSMVQTSLYAKGIAVYSEAADVFELIDNVTRWDKTLTPLYRDAWEKKFPVSLEDGSLFTQYAAVRRKLIKAEELSPTSGDPDVLFGKPGAGFDPFSEAFYSSKSVGEALVKLEKRGLSADDIKFLKMFFGRYKASIAAFIKESSHFSVKLLNLNKDWKYSSKDKALRKFMDFAMEKSAQKGFFKKGLTFLPVWWPSEHAPQIDVRGPYLILRFNPLTHTKEWPLDELAKKGALSILQGLPKNQLSNMGKVFQKKCRGREHELQTSLVTIASEVLPQELKHKKNFDFYQKWSRSSFEDLYIKLLYPLMEREVKKRAYMAGSFMDEASSLCYHLNRLATAP